MAQWVFSSISLPNMVITMNTVAPLKSRIKNKLILVIFQIPTFEIGPVYIFLESKLTVARRKNEDLTRQYNLNDSFMGIK